MKHYASDSFWDCYGKLPNSIQMLADKNFEILKQDARHPSLHLKKVDKYWSVRVGKRHRALAVEIEGGCYGSGSAHTPSMINYLDDLSRDAGILNARKTLSNIRPLKH